MVSKLRRAVVVAALCAPLVVLAGPTGPASAAAPLTVSVANGPPGTKISVSAPDCVTADGVNFLVVALVSADGSSQRLASTGGQADPARPAVLVVPDWLDPAVPARIQAQCFRDDTDDVVDYEPVAFDVEPGTGPGVQTATFSRTTLAAGQALLVSSDGCTVAGEAFAAVDVFAGNDLTGRPELDLVGSGGDIATSGFGEVQGSSFDADVYMTSANEGFSFDLGPNPTITDVDEGPNTIGPGIYTAYPYCTASDTSTSLYFPPQIITVTGSTPTDAIDLVASPTSDSVTVAGSGCTGGPVGVSLSATSIDDLTSDLSGSTGIDGFSTESGVSADSGSDQGDEASADRSSAAAGLGVSRRATRITGFNGRADVRRTSASPHRAGRSLASDGAVDTSVTPDAGGAWTYTDSAGFTDGIVEGFVTCGDPFADGLAYDPQIVRVKVGTAGGGAPILPGTPPPGNAIPGNPAFTG